MYCLYVPVCVGLCHCMYIRMCTFAMYVVCVRDVCMYACTCVRMHVSTFACMLARTYACMYSSMRACMHVYREHFAWRRAHPMQLRVAQNAALSSFTARRGAVRIGGCCGARAQRRAELPVGRDPRLRCFGLGCSAEGVMVKALGCSG